MGPNKHISRGFEICWIEYNTTEISQAISD